MTLINTNLNVFELLHDKTNKIACAPSEDSDQPESSQCTQWVAEDPMCLHADSKDSDQTGWMSRLIGVFAGRTISFLVLS